MTSSVVQPLAQGRFRRVFIWQWGRRGGGPRFAADLANALLTLPGCEVMLSLSARAEIMREESVPGAKMLPVATYRSFIGLLGRLALSFNLRSRLRKPLTRWKPDIAICAMPGPIDLVMASVLRGLGIPVVVVVHDAVAHPGDGFPLQMFLQRQLMRRADLIVALSAHVAAQLLGQGAMRGRTPLLATLPPFGFEHGERGPDGRTLRGRTPHGGPVRLLMFGRLLPYKGIDMLAEALAMLGPDCAYQCRVVGEGPDTAALQELSALAQVQVENRWVPEGEIMSLVDWADVLVLPYREASQSGVGAVGLAAGRWIVSTDVGGLAAQFHNAGHAVLCKPDARSIADALGGLMQRETDLPVIETPDYRKGWTEMAAGLLEGLDQRLPGVGT